MLDQQEKKGIVLEFKASSFRKIPNPYATGRDEDQKKPQIYEALVDITNVPEGIPLDTNPRKQNLNTEVAKALAFSLRDINSANFYLLNRGLLLSAKEVRWNNETGIVSVWFEDPIVHGDVDGGHTYKIILQEQKNIPEGAQFVKIEILTGIEEFFDDLAEARNHSISVDKASLAELRQEFQIIKDALVDDPALDNIRFRANDEQATPIIDVISTLTMFNVGKFPVDYDGDYPVVAYSSKATCLNRFLAEFKEHKDHLETNTFYKMTKIVPTILQLSDYLEEKIPGYYNVKGGKKFGGSAGVAMTPDGGEGFKTRFYQRDIPYLTSKAIIMPILGALRVLVVEEGGFYKFKSDPFECLDEMGPQLVDKTFKALREDHRGSVSQLGKSTAVWKDLFATILLSKYGR